MRDRIFSRNHLFLSCIHMDPKAYLLQAECRTHSTHQKLVILGQRFDIRCSLLEQDAATYLYYFCFSINVHVATTGESILTRSKFFIYNSSNYIIMKRKSYLYGVLAICIPLKEVQCLVLIFIFIIHTLVTFIVVNTIVCKQKNEYV